MILSDDSCISVMTWRWVTIWHWRHEYMALVSTDCSWWCNGVGNVFSESTGSFNSSSASFEVPQSMDIVLVDHGHNLPVFYFHHDDTPGSGWTWTLHWILCTFSNLSRCDRTGDLQPECGADKICICRQNHMMKFPQRESKCFQQHEDMRLFSEPKTKKTPSISMAFLIKWLLSV